MSLKPKLNVFRGNFKNKKVVFFDDNIYTPRNKIKCIKNILNKKFYIRNKLLKFFKLKNFWPKSLFFKPSMNFLILNKLKNKSVGFLKQSFLIELI